MPPPKSLDDDPLGSRVFMPHGRAETPHSVADAEANARLDAGRLGVATLVNEKGSHVEPVQPAGPVDPDHVYEAEESRSETWARRRILWLALALGVPLVGAMIAGAFVAAKQWDRSDSSKPHGPPPVERQLQILPQSP